MRIIKTKKKTNKGAVVIHYHRAKIAAALMLGLIGGASWYYSITETAKALASVFQPNVLAFNNEETLERAKRADEEKKEAERIASTPIDCYTSAEKYGKQYGVSVDLLKRIIKAESGNDTTAENPASTAKGCFQFISGTWKHYSRELWGAERFKKNPFDYEANTELAAYVIGKYGIEKARAEWSESTHNWDK